MTVAVLPETKTTPFGFIQLDDRHGWGFALLLATTVTLFVRPADILPVLDRWPVYQLMIVTCLGLSVRTLLRQLAYERLANQPTTVCLLFLLLAVGASHLAHGFIWGARMSMWHFAKLGLFYLLITGLINSPPRLLAFVKLLVLSIAVTAGLALLDRYDILSIAAFESVRDRGVEHANEQVMVDRLRGTGIFRDPNDYGLMLVFGLTLGCGLLSRPGVGWTRHLWLLPIALLMTALVLTHSRGAFLSLACAVAAIIAYRGRTRVGFAALLCLPLVALCLPGRMTDFGSVHTGTGQTRLQIWAECIAIWRQSPVFGIGEGLLVNKLGVVAHNSFLHCFAELGTVGGVLFLAAFLASGLSLWLLRHRDPTSRFAYGRERDWIDVGHLQLFIFGALAAYAGGIITLSRQSVTPTYLVLGLATAAAAFGANPAFRVKLNNRFLLYSLIASAGIIVIFHLAVRLFVNWD